MTVSVTSVAGMLELQEYARLIEAHEGQEEACGDRCVLKPLQFDRQTLSPAGR